MVKSQFVLESELYVPAQRNGVAVASVSNQGAQPKSVLPSKLIALTHCGKLVLRLGSISTKAWEYKTVAGDIWNSGGLDAAINKRRSEGWEFVSVEVVQGAGGVAMMRRPRIDAASASSN